MAIITLTSDWYKNDYQSLIKGTILRYNPNAIFVEINSQIKSFSILQASFLIRMAYPVFPDGTIHLLLIDSELNGDVRPLIVKHSNQIFIGPDNGIFSLIFGNETLEIYEINVMTHEIGGTFPELTVFADIAGKIAAGSKIEEISLPRKHVKKLLAFQPAWNSYSITGIVLYVDSYGNSVSNISRSLIEKICQGRKMMLYARDRQFPVSNLSERYSDVAEGEGFCLINSIGLLEFGIRKGTSNELQIEAGSRVSLSFYD